MSYLQKVTAASLKSRVIVTDRKTGNTVTVMDSDEFMRAVKAPQTQFVADAITDYNKAHPDMEAKLEMLVSKRGKWKSLGSSDAIPALIRTLAQTLGNKIYLSDLEDLLKRLDPLSSFENETLWHLIRDIKNS